MFDLIIRNGRCRWDGARIFDDVGVVGDTITESGQYRRKRMRPDRGRGRNVLRLDLSDIHTHAGYRAPGRPDHLPK